VSTEWILGVRPEFDGLRIEPCMPPGWKGFTMRRRFRGSVYEIKVRTGAQPRITVDGVPLRSRLVPAFKDARVHTVDVIIAGTTQAKRA